MLYNAKMKNKSRRVKNDKSTNFKHLSGAGYSRSQKARIRSSQRASKIAITKARQYLIYAIGCFLAIQLIKFIMYSVVFTGESSPSGLVFLFIIWLQTGLLLATFVFFVMATIKTLTRLLTE